MWVKDQCSIVSGPVTNNCGTANGQTYSMAGPPGSTAGAICTSGSATNFAARTDSSGYWNGWTWNCGTNSCSANLSPGACGSANGTSRTSAPSSVAERCSAGVSSAVSGSGPWNWSCTGASCSASVQVQAAIGNFESTSASSCSVTGWAFDPDSSSSSLRVDVYRDGPAGSGTFVTSCSASTYRSDVNSSYGISGSHGFSCSLPSSYAGTGSHNLYIHAIDTNGTPNNVIGGSPKSLSCVAPSVCGTSNGGTFDTVPSANLCNPGTVSGPYDNGSSGWYWYCTGNGSAYCTASKSAVWNASCGSNATTYTSSVSAWPSSASTAFCSQGALSGSQPVFPASKGSTVSWTCQSSNGATTRTCSARKNYDPGLLVCPNPAPSLFVGNTTQLAARYFDGSGSDPASVTCSSSGYSDVTSTSTWSPTTSSVASVSDTSGSKGMVTAVGIGSGTVTALYGGISASSMVNVASSPMLLICPNPVPNLTLGGASQQLAAWYFASPVGGENCGSLSGGVDVTSNSGTTWSIVSGSSVSTTSTKGLFKPSSSVSGSTTVKASYLSVSGTTSLTVDALNCSPSASGLPANTEFWSGDDSGLVYGDNTSSVYSASNTSTKCEYTCHSPAVRVGSACVICGVCSNESDHCSNETWSDNCGNPNVCSGGTKDCRQFWKEVAP